jgi:hypothetical protein
MCRLQGHDGDRDIHLRDFRADGGFKEIDAAIENLPVVKQPAQGGGT